MNGINGMNVGLVAEMACVENVTEKVVNKLSVTRSDCYYLFIMPPITQRHYIHNKINAIKTAFISVIYDIKSEKSD
jgi:hypothetical protein